MNWKKLLFTPIFIWLTAFAANATIETDTIEVENLIEHRSEISIYFRVNESHFDENYRDNRKNLDEIVKLLNSINDDESIEVKIVTLKGSASPEGSDKLNRNLSAKRLATLEKIIREKVQLPDSVIHHDPEYIPWTYLVERLKESNVPQKEGAIKIIEEAPVQVYKNGRLVDNRVKQLMAFNNGRTWREMKRLFFKDMRNANSVTVTYKEISNPIIVEREIPEKVDTIQELPLDTVAVVEPDTIVQLPAVDEWQRKLYVKTNVLGLAVAIANAGVEVDIAKHWSFNLPIYYSAWNYFEITTKFRTLAVQPEFRYWFKESNDRWFVGAHFTYAQYNVALDNDYRYQDHNGKSPALGGGVSVGYRLPISKDKKWKMEFSLGAGVYGLYYDKFYNYKNGILVDTQKKTYFGLDQANVSVVYTFGLGKKGGKK